MKHKTKMTHYNKTKLTKNGDRKKKLAFGLKYQKSMEYKLHGTEAADKFYFISQILIFCVRLKNFDGCLWWLVLM